MLIYHTSVLNRWIPPSPPVSWTCFFIFQTVDPYKIIYIDVVRFHVFCTQSSALSSNTFDNPRRCRPPWYTSKNQQKPTTVSISSDHRSRRRSRYQSRNQSSSVPSTVPDSVPKTIPKTRVFITYFLRPQRGIVPNIVPSTVSATLLRRTDSFNYSYPPYRPPYQKNHA